MAAKKAVSLSRLTFAELKDKAKEIEGAGGMNRFEMTQAVKEAQGLKACQNPEKANPRGIKPEIAGLKSKLSATPKEDKKARKELRRAVSRLKRNSRKYL